MPPEDFFPSKPIRRIVFSEIIRAASPVVLFWCLHYFSADRIQVDVSRQFPVMRSILDQDPFVTALEEGTATPMFPIEVIHISGVEVMHSLRQVSVGSPDIDMKVIGHENPGENSPVPARRDLSQEFGPFFPVTGFADDSPTFQTSAGCVVESIRDVDAQWPRHDFIIAAIFIGSKPKKMKNEDLTLLSKK